MHKSVQAIRLCDCPGAKTNTILLITKKTSTPIGARTRHLEELKNDFPLCGSLYLRLIPGIVTFNERISLILNSRKFRMRLVGLYD